MDGGTSPRVAAILRAAMTKVRVAIALASLAFVGMLAAVIALAARPPPAVSPTVVQPTSTTTVTTIQQCWISPSVDDLWYPSNATRLFVVNFNSVLRQANYVVYRVPPPSSKLSTSWKVDPNGANPLPVNCYNSRAGGYEQGHLVPHAAFGRATDYMANAVPMVKQFNRITWAAVETEIRSKHVGMLVTIGCGYEGQTVPGQFLRGCVEPVELPSGCFYAVLDDDNATATGSAPSTLVDHAYYANANSSVRENRLPPWLVCEDKYVSS